MRPCSSATAAPTRNSEKEHERGRELGSLLQLMHARPDILQRNLPGAIAELPRIFILLDLKKHIYFDPRRQQSGAAGQIPRLCNQQAPLVPQRDREMLPFFE